MAGLGERGGTLIAKLDGTVARTWGNRLETLLAAGLVRTRDAAESATVGVVRGWNSLVALSQELSNHREWIDELLGGQDDHRESS